MESLDLRVNDPEEFEGKSVTYRNCQYLVGTYVASGQEKFVHKLVNMKSGLHLHLLMIYRNQAEAAKATGRATAAKALGNMLDPDLVPDIDGFEGAGGWLEVQEYIGPYESEESRTHSLMMDGDRLTTTESYPSAIEKYREVLKINPYHTVALNNLGYCLAQQDDLVSGSHCLADALDIEPNYLPYYRSFIEIAAGGGMLGRASAKFMRMKAQFWYEHSLDALGIQLFLNTGHPEEADRLFNWANGRDSEGNEEVRAAIERAQVARRRAEEAMRLAKETLMEGELDRSLTILRERRPTDPRVPVLDLNLGLLLICDDRVEEGYAILREVMFLLLPPQDAVCLRNIAFAELRMGRALVGLKILEDVTPVESSCDDEKVPNVSAPTVWSDDEGYLELRISEGLRLIENALASPELSEGEVRQYSAIRVAYGRAAAQEQSTLGDDE